MVWTMQCTRKGLVRLVVPFLLLAGLLAGGCTTFNHAWTEAAKESFATNSLLGCWEGTWLSDANGHNGNLRCVVTLKNDGTYKARFHAIYKKVLGFGYTVTLKAAETNGVWGLPVRRLCSGHKFLFHVPLQVRSRHVSNDAAGCAYQCGGQTGDPRPCVEPCPKTLIEMTDTMAWSPCCKSHSTITSLGEKRFDGNRG
jgi:hypothetical protein